jgi:hypothetical protein
VSAARPTIALVRVPWTKPPPTDFELLRAIYKRHRDEYAESIASGQSIVMVPIDLPGIAQKCINFPLLEAVFARLWQQRRRDPWTLWVAFVSIGIAIGSLVVSIATARPAGGSAP